MSGPFAFDLSFSVVKQFVLLEFSVLSGHHGVELAGFLAVIQAETIHLLNIGLNRFLRIDDVFQLVFSPSKAYISTVFLPSDRFEAPAISIFLPSSGKL